MHCVRHALGRSVLSKTGEDCGGGGHADVASKQYLFDRSQLVFTECTDPRESPHSLKD
jgi:hypothetical protein